MPQRQALIERITRLRRQAAADAQQRPPEPGTGSSDPLSGLERRIAHLEKLVEGLQDSVHRESTRHSKQIADLESQIEPSVLAVALDEDARRRGL